MEPWSQPNPDPTPPPQIPKPLSQSLTVTLTGQILLRDTALITEDCHPDWGTKDGELWGVTLIGGLVERQ